jgi:hypothetical protein
MMKKKVVLAMYAGEEPVVFSCGDLTFEIGYTAIRLLATELQIMDTSQMSQSTRFHVKRFAKALGLLNEETMRLTRSKTTPEEDKETMERYHRTGFGCVADEF